MTERTGRSSAFPPPLRSTARSATLSVVLARLCPARPDSPGSLVRSCAGPTALRSGRCLRKELKAGRAGEVPVPRSRKEQIPCRSSSSIPVR